MPEPYGTIAALGLTIEAKFIPWSQSRNKGEDRKSLNWKVALLRNGKQVLETYYSAGSGHCPGKATRAPSSYHARDRRRTDGKPYPGTTSAYRTPTEAERLSDYLDALHAMECETGFAHEYTMQGFRPRRVRNTGRIPILPGLADVLYPLVIDASVLDYSGFEDWAANFGYEPDSRKAEAIYKSCIEIALHIRNGVGEDGLAKLQAAFQDY
jgi:hypothetical protein